MKIVKTISEIREIVKDWRKAGYSIGLVPTMGYLHAGHGSLIEQSVKNNDKTVVSVFVNPTQFGPNEDLEKYPRDIERDSKLVESLGGDIIFNPEASEMYNTKNYTYITVQGLSEKLCGITRPTHFAGVCQVVSKLFHIVMPDNAYFGLKDFQQYVIIKTMVEDLNFPVKINPVNIVREESGIAMSSRNVYLTDLIKQMQEFISSHPYTKIDYIKIVDINTLEDIAEIPDNNYAVLLAVYVGKTRLIDNFVQHS